MAVRSKFGWLLSGPVKSKDDEYVTRSNVVIHRPFDTQQETDGEGELVDELRRFWDLESVGITEVSDKGIREESFPASIKYNFINGRYEVKLPWNSNRPESTNQGMCLVRLRQLMARLKRSPALLQEYNKIFQTQLEANIIELVPKAEWNACNAHFLPHHGVVREDKDTTKLRIVFDGSAKVEKSHHSLNECLEKGPNLTPLVFDMLLKFRMRHIGITADIEKAFHQIMIKPDDRDMLRLLWLDDVSSREPQVVQYRFCRLVFGITPSPAILQCVIQHHLSRYKNSHEEIVKLLLDTLYVDDFPGGAANREEGFHVYCQAKEVMNGGGFNLRKWRTNDQELQLRINEAEGVKSDSETGRSRERPIKILGLSWDTCEDYFCFEFKELIKFVETLPPSKRSLLRVSAKIFDPLGFLSPFTVSTKILFQSLCLDKVKWDDRLEGEALLKWNGLIHEFLVLTNLRVPRCCLMKDQIVLSCELHGFSDASERAYAAVVYLKIVYQQGGAGNIQFVASRTRVCPLKKQHS